MQRKISTHVPNLEPIAITDNYNKVGLRNAILLTFFFGKSPEQVSEQIGNVLEEYIKLIPVENFKSALTDAGTDDLRPFNSKTLTACQKQLSAAGVKRRKLTHILLVNHGSESADCMFEFEGRQPDKDIPNPAQVLNMVFPIYILTPDKIDVFFEKIKTIGEKLDFLSGYCSPALVRPPGRNLLGSKLHLAISNLSSKYPGYDISNNNEMSYHLGNKVKGAYWVTFLNEKLIKKLGGLTTLKQNLKPPISIESISNGILIRAGDLPEIGDTELKIETPLLRQVARVLEPISYFGNLFNPLYTGTGNKELLKNWERRFLDE